MRFFTHARHVSALYCLRNKTVNRNAVLLKRLALSFLFLGLFVQVALAADPVTGKVTDEKGNPLPGVTVQVKGKEGGVTTGNDGKFTIDIPDAAATLVFTYVGFTS